MRVVLHLFGVHTWLYGANYTIRACAYCPLRQRLDFIGRYVTAKR